MATESEPLNIDKQKTSPEQHVVLKKLHTESGDTGERYKIHRCCKHTPFLISAALIFTAGFCVWTWYFFKTNGEHADRSEKTSNTNLHVNDDGAALHTAVKLSKVESRSSIAHKENAMDLDADPCEDFYTFVCGRWNFSASGMNVAEDMRANFYSVIEETEMRNLLKLESYLKCSSFRGANAWSRYVKKTYDLCEKERHWTIKESTTVAFAKDIAAPLLESNYNNQWSLDETLLKTQHRQLQKGLFTWDVTLDLKNDEIIQALRISPPEKSWYSNLMNSSHRQLTKYVAEVLLLLGANEEELQEKCEEIVQTSLLMSKNLTNGRKMFEQRTRIIYSEFVKEFNFIDFSRYFDDVSVPDSVLVVIEGVEYFQWLRSYLNQSKKNYRAVQNIVIWSLIDFLIQFMPNRFLEIRYKYGYKTGFKAKELLDGSHVCLNAVKKGMNFAVSSFFMDKVLDNKSRNMINDIVLHVKNSFRDYLQQLHGSNPGDGKWINGVEYVFKSIEIGVPVHLREIYEQDLPFEMPKLSFLSHYLSAVYFVKSRMLSYIQKVPQAVLFIPDFLQLNGIFVSLPLLMINMGILTPPFFDPQQLLCLNYAGLGFVISHELAHSIDYLASNISSLKKELKSKTDCLHHQYSYTGRSSEVKQEDFADNVGIKIAYKAFLEHNALHNTGNIAPRDQMLFFIHYGQIFCEDGSSFDTQSNADHSPFKLRINRPLSNFPDFAKTFSCPFGSKMNVSNKCII